MVEAQLRRVTGTPWLRRLLVSVAVAASLHLTLNIPMYLYNPGAIGPRAIFALAIVTIATAPFIAAALASRFARFPLMLMFVGAAALSVASAAKLSARGEPLIPADFAFAGNAGAVLDYGSLPEASVLVLVAIAAAAGAALSFFTAGRLGRFGRMGVTLLLGLCLVSGYGFARVPAGGGPIIASLSVGGYDIPTFVPASVYQDNGFTIGALAMYDPGDPLVDYEPTRFSDTAEALTFLGGLRASTPDRSPRGGSRPNVVVVLDESYSDPFALPDIEGASGVFDPLQPDLARGAIGTVRATSLGGGTGDMEYQVLTGLPLSALSNAGKPAFVKTVSTRKRFSSFVDTFEDLGYESYGLHPYTGDFYSRASAWRTLGFDEAEFQDNVPDSAKRNGNGYVLDSEVFNQLTERLRETTTPVFANVVTMQNHVPWDGAWPDVQPVDGSAAGFDDAENRTLSQYVHGLRESSTALAELLADLGQLQERTVVVVYGDHLPSFYPAEFIRDINAQAYETPLFLFDSSRNLDSAQLGEVSPTQVLPLAMEAAGLPLPPLAAGLVHLTDPTVSLEAEGGAPVPEALWWATRGELVGEGAEGFYKVPDPSQSAR